MDSASIVAPIQELIPAVPEPQPEVTPPAIGSQETEKETKSTDSQSEEKTKHELNKSLDVLQSEIKSNPESETDENVILIESADSKSEQVLDTPERTEAVSQSETAAESPVTVCSEPETEPVSEQTVEMKRD